MPVRSHNVATATVSAFPDVAASDLGLSSLEGSFRKGLIGIPDVPGPLDSACVAFSPSLEAEEPAYAPRLPPLENRAAERAPLPTCDPHILTFTWTGRRVPPARRQGANLFAGLEPEERACGNADRCDPTVG